MSKFTLRTVPSGFRFQLKAANGEALLTSEVYTTEAACRKGIDSVIKNAAVAGVADQTREDGKAVPNPRFEVYKDRTGAFRFRLKARNGETIGKSKSYAAKAGALGGIESIRKNAPAAEISLDQPNKKTATAMLEAERIGKDPSAKGYTDLDELFADLKE